MANGDPKTYQDGWADGYRQGLIAAGMLTQPVVPTHVPYEAYLCPSCGLNFSGTMGYVCPRSSCPIQPKVT